MRYALLLPLLALTACQTADTPEGDGAATDDVSVSAPDGAEVSVATDDASVVAVGDRLDDGAAFVTPATLVADASTLDGQTVAVEGTVRTVCQQAGCWMTLDAGDGQSVRVVVPKDDAGEYVYTFPKDVAGATARLVGTFAVTEESVEMQRHLAEDDGASAEDIAAITEPVRSLTLTATGARIVRA
jgi:hypothetical protein